MNFQENKRQITPNYQSFGEEIANAITHGLGFGLSIVAMVIMATTAAKNGTAWHVVGVTIFGSSLILLYLNSTIYHAIPHTKQIKALFRHLDHICIYILIAGTYTALCITILRGTLGWTIFGIQWGLAIAGIIYKIVFGERYNFASTLIYLLMGWMALICINQLYSELNLSGFLWLLAGGLFYSLGVIFYFKDQKIEYFHSIWHIFVLCGSVCHFFCVLYFVIPSANA